MSGNNIEELYKCQAGTYVSFGSSKYSNRAKGTLLAISRLGNERVFVRIGFDNGKFAVMQAKDIEDFKIEQRPADMVGTQEFIDNTQQSKNELSKFIVDHATGTVILEHAPERKMALKYLVAPQIIRPFTTEPAIEPIRIPKPNTVTSASAVAIPAATAAVAASPSIDLEILAAQAHLQQLKEKKAALTNASKAGDKLKELEAIRKVQLQIQQNMRTNLEELIKKRLEFGTCVKDFIHLIQPETLDSYIQSHPQFQAQAQVIQQHFAEGKQIDQLWSPVIEPFLQQQPITPPATNGSAAGVSPAPSSSSAATASSAPAAKRSRLMYPGAW